MSDAMAGSSYSASTGTAPLSAAESLHRVRAVDPDGPRQDSPRDERKEEARKRLTAHGAVVVEDQLQISPEALARSHAVSESGPFATTEATPPSPLPPIQPVPPSFETVA